MTQKLNIFISAQCTRYGIKLKAVCNYRTAWLLTSSIKIQLNGTTCIVRIRGHVV